MILGITLILILLICIFTGLRGFARIMETQEYQHQQRLNKLATTAIKYDSKNRPVGLM